MRTLVLIKPDGVRRNLVGEILGRYERKGLKLLAIKSLKPTRDMAEEHYEEHRGKGFFEGVVEYLSSDAVIALILGGENAVKCVRAINGATKYYEALPGTIRGDFAFSMEENLVHASDSDESAEREIKIWFPEVE
jgi:nucleoside-diphosphate kinase